MSCDTTTIPTLARTEAELAEDLKFARAYAKKIARHPDIDSEGIATDALIKAISKPVPDGYTFRRWLCLCIRSILADKTRKADRRNSLLSRVDIDLHKIPDRPSMASCPLDGLSDFHRQLARDVLVDKISERAAAAQRGMTRNQIRNSIALIVDLLKKQLGGY